MAQALVNGAVAASIGSESKISYAKVEPESGVPFIEGMNKKGFRENANSVRARADQIIVESTGANLSTRQVGNDLKLEATFSSSESSLKSAQQVSARVEIDPSASNVGAVQFVFEPDKMVKNRLADPSEDEGYLDFFSSEAGGYPEYFFAKNGVRLSEDITINNSRTIKIRKQFNGKAAEIPTTFLESDGVQTQVMLNHIHDFFGVQFVAQSDASATWLVNLETDFTRKLSKPGKRVLLQAEFRPTADLSYFTVPFTKFKATVNGEVRNDIPGIAKAGYGPKTLNLRSVGFELKDPPLAKSDLTVHDGEVSFGFFYSAEFEQAKTMLMEAADLYEHQPVNSLTGHASDIRTVVRLMDQMSTKLNHFPELESFQNIPDIERVEYFRKLLLLPSFKSKVNYHPRELPFSLGVDETLGKDETEGKITVDTVWRNIGFDHAIPSEVGYFGLLHTKYGHWEQFAAMLQGHFEDEDIQALERVLGPRNTFLFFWALIFDSRQGGANDPAPWRHYEKSPSNPPSP